MSERYCLRCSKVVLDPNVNYGINPDVVCKCPPEQPSLASGIPHHQVSQWTETTQERSAIDRALWSEIGLAIGRIEANLQKAEKSREIERQSQQSVYWQSAQAQINKLFERQDEHKKYIL